MNDGLRLDGFGDHRGGFYHRHYRGGVSHYDWGGFDYWYYRGGLNGYYRSGFQYWY